MSHHLLQMQKFTYTAETKAEVDLITSTRRLEFGHKWIFQMENQTKLVENGLSAEKSRNGEVNKHIHK